jgi:hypothetical protein
MTDADWHRELDRELQRDRGLDRDEPARGRLPAVPASVEQTVEALPGLARVAAHAGWHTASWGLRTSLRTGRRLARVVGDPDEAGLLAREATVAAATVGAVARAVTSGTPLPRALVQAGEALAELSQPPGEGQRPSEHHPGREARSREVDTSPAGLRRRGAELLERSRDVWDDEQAHPAYERILGELAPDEARVLLLLLERGPQPSVDVRTGGPIGMVNSQLIAPGLSMIGARAGCRYLDQVPSYLNNLFRLGLVWFSREALRDPMEYQVVEAQPDVLAAVHSVKFAKVVRRSIHLTPFGEDFCRTCLVEDDVAAAVFPGHGTPPAAQAGDQPR